MANLTLYNVAICVVVAIGGFTYGFAFAAFVTTIGEPGFFRDFDLDRMSPNPNSPIGMNKTADTTPPTALSSYTAT